MKWTLVTQQLSGILEEGMQRQYDVGQKPQGILFCPGSKHMKTLILTISATH